MVPGGVTPGVLLLGVLLPGVFFPGVLLPYQRVGGARRLAYGYKSGILVSLKVLSDSIT